MSDPTSWRLSDARIRQFDAAAHVYHSNRPPFPGEAFDRLIEVAALRPGSSVLEIGAGSGRATAELVARGLHVTALEPGPTLRAIGQETLRDARPTVDWIPGRFEEWEPGRQRFDLVFAADAWHWIEPTHGARRAAAALVPRGHLAVLWSVIEGFEPAAFGELLGEAWEAAGAGDETRRWLASMADEGGAWIEPVVATGLFEPAELSRHPFERRMTGAELVSEFGSYGWVLALERPRRDALLRSMERLVTERFGGAILRRDMAVLYVLRRSQDESASDDSVIR